MSVRVRPTDKNGLSLSASNETWTACLIFTDSDSLDILETGLERRLSIVEVPFDTDTFGVVNFSDRNLILKTCIP
jgi:hypothetical protein